MGSHSLLQGIFLIQGLNPGFPYCRRILYCLSHQGSPRKKKIDLYVICIAESICCTHETLKLTQNYKSTILQLKKRRKKGYKNAFAGDGILPHDYLIDHFMPWLQGTDIIRIVYEEKSFNQLSTWNHTILFLNKII